jgi:hypothetical protein
MQEDAMSYTIVTDDGDEKSFGANPLCLHIRAMISTRSELEELIAKLNRRLETDFAQGEKHEHDSTAEPVRSGTPALPDPRFSYPPRND